MSLLYYTSNLWDDKLPTQNNQLVFTIIAMQYSTDELLEYTDLYQYNLQALQNFIISIFFFMQNNLILKICSLTETTSCAYVCEMNIKKNNSTYSIVSNKRSPLVNLPLPYQVYSPMF